MRAEQRILVDLPVAGVEHAAIGRLDQQRVAFGDRVRERHVGEAERAEREAAVARDRDELHLLGDPLLLQLAADQPRGEGRGVERHAEIGGQIGDRADMILMPVREHDADQAVGMTLDEVEIGEHEIDAGIGGIGEGEAEIDHHPFAVAAVEIDVHADFARAAEREEEELFAWNGHAVSDAGAIRPP